MTSSINIGVLKCLTKYRHFSTLCKNVNKCEGFPAVQNVTKRWLFWEPDRKGGYDTAHKVPFTEHLKNGFKEIKNEFRLLSQEMKDLIETDPLLVARPGE